MSKTLSGAIRDYVVAANLDGIDAKVYLDFAPHDTIPPYLTYNDHVSTAPELKGDGKTIEFNRVLQYNVWQHSDHEDMFLPTRLVQALDGATVRVEGEDTAMKLSVQSLTRLPGEQDEEIIHHELTIGITHPTSVA